ncbi:MAG: D-alanyl-D-alanine carboxypeptidase family protein [Actinomycetota bacterium]
MVFIPTIGGAKTNDNPSAEREAVRAKKAQVASQVDALKATDAEVSAALDALQANVKGQEALLAEANRAAEAAEAAHTEAIAAVEAKQAETAALREDIRDFAVQAFVHPPADDAMAALDTADPSEAAQKRALLDLQNTNELDLLDRLTALEEDLEVQRQLAEEASQRAEEKRAAAAGRLSELEAARDQQAAYAAEVEARLDRALSEVASLERVDAELSAKIQKQQEELARKAAAAAAARPRSSGGGGGSSRVTFNGSLSSVSCHTGGSITVNSSIAGNVKSMLDAAAADGVMLCGGGYRSSEGQIQTRKNNCGTSYYAIYEMPASQCSPPTARPGTSMHEQGLAIDFNNCSSRSTACYQWLSGNASSFGFHNLPSEPWHWSTNGN